MPRIQNYNADPVILDRVAGSLKCVSQVLAVGAMIEIRWAAILAAIAGADVISAVTLLDRLRNVQSKQEAVLAVAKERLVAEDHRVLASAAIAVKGHRDRRNSFCHDVWASAVELPDAAVLIPAKLLAMSNAHFAVADNLNYAAAVALIEVDVPDTNIYRAADFRRVSAEAIEAGEVIHGAHRYAEWCRRAALGGPAGGPAKDNILEALTSFPSFAAAFERKRV